MGKRRGPKGGDAAGYIHRNQANMPAETASSGELFWRPGGMKKRGMKGERRRELWVFKMGPRSCRLRPLTCELKTRCINGVYGHDARGVCAVKKVMTGGSHLSLRGKRKK